MVYVYLLFTISGWWFFATLLKNNSQLGLLFPIYGKNKNSMYLHVLLLFLIIIINFFFIPNIFPIYYIFPIPMLFAGWMSPTSPFCTRSLRVFAMFSSGALSDWRFNPFHHSDPPNNIPKNGTSDPNPPHLTPRGKYILKVLRLWGHTAICSCLPHVL